MPFFKRDGNDLLSAPEFVIGPNNLNLRADTHTEHLYPVDGWYWFDTLDAAMVGMPKAISPNATITPLQAKLALLGAGLLDQVETLVANADRATKISWTEAANFNRASPLLNVMAQALGLSASQLDSLFIEASQIDV